MRIRDLREDSNSTQQQVPQHLNIRRSAYSGRKPEQDKFLLMIGLGRGDLCGVYNFGVVEWQPCAR